MRLGITNRLKLLPLIIIQILVKPFQGKGLQNITVFPWLYKKLITLAKSQTCSLIISPPGMPSFQLEVDMRMGGIGRSLIVNHEYEPLETKLFSYYLAKARVRGVVIDVGANIGYYSIMAGNYLKPRHGVVYAYEPEFRNRLQLYSNKNLNNLYNVIVKPVAASDIDGEATLFVSNTEWGEHSLQNLSNIRKVDKTIKVRTERLDSIVKPSSFDGLAVSLIKIDVEGSELKVLRGAKHIIESCHPVIILECWEYALNAAGDTIENLFGQLDTFEYEVYLINECDQKINNATPELVRVYYEKHRSCNLLCLYKEYCPEEFEHEYE